MPELLVGSVQQRSREIDASLGFPMVTARDLTNLRDEQQRPCRAIPTPFPSLNIACRGSGGGRGLGPGWFVVVSGPTGGGKTLFALNLLHAAQRSGANSVFVSLELSRSEILTRYRPIVSGLDTVLLEQGTHFDPAAAAKADAEIMDLPGHLFMNPSPLAELEGISLAIDELVRSEGVQLVVVDYVQLLTTAGRDADLFARMAEVSAELRFAARRTGVTVIALSQLNRARERNQPPAIEHLFGSSRFGFDSDLVLVLDYTNAERYPIQRRTRLHLRTLKARHGPSIAIPIELSTTTLRFKEIGLET